MKKIENSEKLLKERDFEELNKFLKETTKRIDPIIKELLELYVNKKFYKFINYQAFTGGKRLRPALVIASGKLLNGKMKDIIYPAAGLEILHNSTLIVDDLIDHSKLRRNKPTLWSKYGKSMAECLGLDYLAVAFEGANRSKKPKETIGIFINTSKAVVSGEILDILFEQDGREEEPYVVENRYKEITKQNYYKMVSKKTAILIQACCEVGAINANASKKEIELLKEYGYNLGMAFQIRDDILDIFGDKKTGKKIGGDIEERKLGNIVILLAIEEFSKNDKEKFLKIFKRKNITDKNIKEIIDLIKKTNSYNKACSLSENFAKKSRESLKKLPQNKWNKILNTFVDFSTQRMV